MIRDAMLARTEAEWDALEEAYMSVISLRPGHKLTAEDVAAILLVDKCHREDDETATDAYNRGWNDGLRSRGGDELVELHRRIDDAFIKKSTERTMRQLAEARALTAEARLAEAVEALKHHIDGRRFSEFAGEQWQHLKRGTTYTLPFGRCEVGVQTSAPLEDGDVVIVYIGENGMIWARPPHEFFDGRFKRVALSSHNSKSGEQTDGR